MNERDFEQEFIRRLVKEQERQGQELRDQKQLLLQFEKKQKESAQKIKKTSTLFWFTLAITVFTTLINIVEQIVNLHFCKCVPKAASITIFAINIVCMIASFIGAIYKIRMSQKD